MSSGLDTRPSATTYDLEDLVQQAWLGYVRVPHFQRPFRWGAQDVVRLFDSIVRGYPIGSILLWVRDAPEDKIRLGALVVRAPKADRAFWVVDGQQRLTSLANALHPDGAADPRFALGYDLRTRSFTTLKADRDARIIPLPVLFDLQKLIRWFAEHPEVADRMDDATGVAKTIRQFKIPAYQVEHGTEDVLRDIFDRMNNYGKRLSRAEVFSALYADAGEGEHGLDIAGIAEYIDAETRFGAIDADTVLRAILARRGPDVTREIRTEFNDDDRRTASEFPGEGREAAYEAGKVALLRAVLFLQETVGVPHFTMLPYRYLLVVLTRLFAHYPDPRPRHLILLRRWYWRAALAGPEVFKGSATGAMRALCSRVRTNDLALSIDDLLAAVGRGAAPPKLTRFRTNEAAAKIVLCAWWDMGPRSPLTGAKFSREDLADALEQSSTAAPVVPYIVGSRLLPPQFQASAANRALIVSNFASESDALFTQPPVDVDTDLWNAVLASHSVTFDMARALAAGRYEVFFRDRHLLLTQRLQSFINAACEFDFEDTPALGDLVSLTEDEDE